jgi:NAD(P)-dependent dehydrogenase (short-subunit alcohol dehydrogenase family)/acyl dehydratase/putative sterol carrier protein
MKLKNKVALVTGAGGGLGRTYALLFAKEGAKVVVNDLGGTRDGGGAGSAMADKVVAEIKEMGGEAVANYGSVSNAADAQAMIDQAVSAFGKIDIVVNNAGILRDKTLVKMTDEMWDLVIDVHLKGTYLVTKAAVLAMGEKGGRIINTSSLAGLLGNYGQANYGAAKAGIAGLTRVVAKETQKMGITVNAIAPVAKTRMTQEISMVPESFEPEDIAPLVGWLASDEALHVTGRVFGAHGSHYFEYVVEQTPGIDLGEKRWTLDSVGQRFEEITAMPKGAPVLDAASGGLVEDARKLFAAIPATYRAEKAGDWKAKMKFDLGGLATFSLIVAGGATEFLDGAVDGATATVTFDGPQTILDMARGVLAPEQAFMGGKVKTDNMGALMKFGQYFNLGKAAAVLGDVAPVAGSAPKKAGLNKELVGKVHRGSASYVLKEDIQAFTNATDDLTNPAYLEGTEAPPIFPVRPLLTMLHAAIADSELNADMLRLVHGEQDMRFHRHLKPWDLAAPRAEIQSIETKASGELLNVRQWLMVDGEMTTEVISGLFIRGESEGGGEKKPVIEAPKHDYIYTEKQTVIANHPMRYADASLDRNPIHLDEDVAKAAGHPSVILHGLCTMAFASRAVVNGVCGGKPERLKRLKVRFAKPVLPGWGLETRIWKESTTDGVTTYGLEVVNQDGVVVITNGIAEVV